MLKKPAHTQVPLHDIIARRWSPRAFDPTRPVSREQVTALLEAARWAPSCFGDQPWRFIVWDQNRDRASWDQAFDCLVEFNQQWVKHAPVLVSVLADSLFTGNGKPNRWGPYDTGAASENLCLQAVALGLAAHQMGGFDADKLRRTFSIPEQFQCMAMIAVGYQAEPDTLSGEIKESELAARSRRPLEQTCFDGTWGAPLTAG